MSGRYAAIFFDLDGTLVSEHAGEREARLAAGGAARALGLCGAEPREFADAADAAYAAIMDEHGHAWPQWITDAVWLGRTLERLGAAEPPQVALEEVADAYKRERLACTAAIEGAHGAVEAGLQQGPVAVISNYTEPRHQRRKLEAAGLAVHFEHVFISGEIGHAKPDPRIFEHAAGALGVPVEECVHIGNSWESDIKGALAAGADAIWFEEDPRPGVQSPDPRVPRFECMHDVAAHLQRRTAAGGTG